MERIEKIKKDLLLKKSTVDLTWRELGFKFNINYSNLFNFVYGKRKTLPEKTLLLIEKWLEKSGV